MFLRSLFSAGQSRKRDEHGFPGAIEGRFDIKGDVLFGTVGRVTGVKNGAMYVVAKRRGGLVAEHVIPNTGARWLDFTMPIEGRFAIEEIARETVVISARNDRGDTGTLTMNGGTRLELIRTYMGIPVETVFDLDFRHSGNARPFLGTGWSPAEQDFTWATGNDSLIHFNTPETRGTYLLRMLYATTFLTEFIKDQTLDIFVNENQVASFSENTKAGAFREFRVGWDVLGVEHRSTIRLNHPRAARPSDQLGARDDRRLAFCFKRISLVRALPELP